MADSSDGRHLELGNARLFAKVVAHEGHGTTALRFTSRDPAAADFIEQVLAR